MGFQIAGSPPVYLGQQQQNPRKMVQKAITGAVNNGSGLIRITALNHTFRAADRITITGVNGTTEANGSLWAINVIDGDHFDLVGSAFVHAYTSGGIASRP
jgi:hypothetical protein